MDGATGGVSQAGASTAEDTGQAQANVDGILRIRPAQTITEGQGAVSHSQEWKRSASTGSHNDAETSLGSTPRSLRASGTIRHKKTVFKTLLDKVEDVLHIDLDGDGVVGTEKARHMENFDYSEPPKSIQDEAEEEQTFIEQVTEKFSNMMHDEVDTFYTEVMTSIISYLGSAHAPVTCLGAPLGQA